MADEGSGCCRAGRQKSLVTIQLEDIFGSK